MKFATLNNNTRDGELVVVDTKLYKMATITGVPTLQFLLDNWDSCIVKVMDVSQKLNNNEIVNTLAYDTKLLYSPLPRAYQWVDGSAYLYHVELVRKARGAEMPPDLYNDPLMYQGCSDSFLAPNADICFPTTGYGIDFEAEVAVITGDVPMGVSAMDARKYIRLVMLVNDVSLRNLIPQELGKNFGFLQSKPASSFSPIAVTPDELGNNWNGAKLSLPLYSYLNGKLFGQPNAGVDLQFDFGQLIAHAAKTRNLASGTIVGSGTVSNRSGDVGSSCIAEVRMLEIIAHGKANTPFMQHNDVITIEMLNNNNENIFGSISQKVVIK